MMFVRPNQSVGAARAGVFTTPHGPVDTPAFMAVGTAATVKALDPLELEAIGCQMILANTYHLHLRPGDEIVRSLGGVHRFMGWGGPMLTDSGGFQVFSLESLRTVSEDGVEFRSHIDGSRHRFTPESVMLIQRNLGADVIMQFDHVIPGQSVEAEARDASERSIRWLARCKTEFDAGKMGRGDWGSGLTALLTRLPSPVSRLPNKLFSDRPRGYPLDPKTRSIPRDPLHRRLAWLRHWWPFRWRVEARHVRHARRRERELPTDRPRYLMGVGFPEDLGGVWARRRHVATASRPREWAETAPHLRPTVASTCGAPSSSRPSATGRDVRVLHVQTLLTGLHPPSLRRGRDPGLRLVSLHNVHFLVALMRRSRAAVIDGTFDARSRDWLARYHSRPTPVS